MGTFIATIFKVRAHAVEIAAHPWNALLCVIALRSSRVRLHGCGIAQMAHGGAPVRTCKEGEQSATHELTVDRHDSAVQQKNVQFHGWSSRLICFRSCCICALSSAVPIITALRQAREANIPRSLEGRHLRHMCDRQRQPAGKGDKNRDTNASAHHSWPRCQQRDELVHVVCTEGDALAHRHGLQPQSPACAKGLAVSEPAIEAMRLAQWAHLLERTDRRQTQNRSLP